MTDTRAQLKAMINAMIEKDDDKASSEFHSYLAAKMQTAMQKVNVANTSENNSDE